MRYNKNSNFLQMSSNGLFYMIVSAAAFKDTFYALGVLVENPVIAK